ncbi:MAG: hypothetical protein WAM60_23125 [Candidatus Promineifilaceae bacterium]
MNQQITSSQRRYELDWLRVIAIFLVFLFHSAVSLTIIVMLYEFIIRRVNLLRVLFGMKPLFHKSADLRGEPALGV